MKILNISFTFSFLIVFYTLSIAQSGEQTFKTVCATCHTIGKGKLVGPDLKDVDKRHEEAWMLKWVKSSQTMVKEGDPTAVKLFNDNNKIPMPDQPTFTDDQIKSVLAYIKTTGDAAAVQPANASEVSSVSPSGSQSPSLFSTFSFTEYLLLGLILIMLIIIWVLSRSIKNLSMQLSDNYSGTK